MKTIKRIVAASFFMLAAPAATLVLLNFHTGCTTTPTERTTQVTTLKVLGASRDAAMKTAAQLLKDGKITWKQWDEIAKVHEQFQAAYRLAVVTVQSDLSSVASPDLMKLWGELASLVATFQKPTP